MEGCRDVGQLIFARLEPMGGRYAAEPFCGGDEQPVVGADEDIAARRGQASG
jgi:hypothetical protein